ncbi:MAG: hypothetical protein V3R30_00785 [Kiloniellales bacterium]
MWQAPVAGCRGRSSQLLPGAAIFPKTDPTELPADFGEPATYRSDSNQSYEAEHETIFQPMERLLTLIRRTSSGINHIVGAIG